MAGVGENNGRNAVVRGTLAGVGENNGRNAVVRGAMAGVGENNGRNAVVRRTAPRRHAANADRAAPELGAL
ncbi:hypothetical protein [Paenibacillus jilunlii]|uniref:Uncharacterized protein n=1 Tax=Paenibacillus jilunlii TaxID=682956 RepID=A0A1G9Z3K7_9BACL|nr:hypothetical protein [Paenibacillus jilunlii]KWX79497.1 hypothetical protein AML91_02715 [Paenibacillus jilunlii]SDN15276.1 hypothetical protein SAMN05216191_12923 [Paenibacillus jilunlii]